MEHPFLYEYLHPTHVGVKLLALARALSPDKYQEAKAEAERIQKEKAIPMIVEGIKPVHLKMSEFKLPVGDTIGTLKSNTAFYPVGIFSTDASFDAMKWYRGAKTEYLFDWFCKYVASLLEKQAIMVPQPVFKGNETFTFTVVCSEAKTKVDAWLLGYVVLPETMAEQAVIL